MKDNKYISSSSVGLCELVFVVFLALKLCNIIDWSWWWVTAPMWIQLVIVAIAIIVIFFVGLYRAIKNKPKLNLSNNTKRTVKEVKNMLKKEGNNEQTNTSGN